MMSTGGSSAFAFLSLPDFVSQARVDELVAKVDTSNPDGHPTTLLLQKKWLGSHMPHIEYAPFPKLHLRPTILNWTHYL
jgi:hypothetical protein